MQLVLARHGQTDANVQKIAFSKKDIEINDEGKKQAHMLGVYLKSLDLQVETIYSSQLKRALETAAIVGTYLGKDSICIDPLLREISFGELEGSNRETMIRLEFGYKSEEIQKAGGESVIDIENRVNAFLHKLAALNLKSVLCVSHGMTLSVFTNILLQEERVFENIRAHMNADCSIFELDLNIVAGNIQPVLNSFELYCINEKPAF